MSTENRNNGDAFSGKMGISLDNFTEEETIHFGIAICEAIIHAVGEDGFHGAVRPDNVIITQEGKVMLGEGAPQVTSDLKPEELEYLAPEIFWDGRTSAAGDVYSLGLMLFAARNRGRLPFLPQESVLTSEARAGAVQRRMKDEPIAAPLYSGPELAAVILRAVAFSPAERFSCAREFEEALRSCYVEIASVMSEDEVRDKLFEKEEGELTYVEKLMTGIASPPFVPAKPLPPLEPKPLPEKEEPSGADLPPGENESVHEGAIADPRENIGDEKPPEADREKDQDVVLAPLPISPDSKKSATRQTRRSGGQASSGNKPPVGDDAGKVRRTKKGRRNEIYVLTGIILFLGVVVLMFFRGVGIFAPGESTPTPDMNSSSPLIRSTPTPTPSPSPGPSPTPGESTPPEPEIKYELVAENCSWEVAKQRCEEMGGHLATIASQEELLEMLSSVDTSGIKYIWLGAKRDDAGEWNWLTGETVDYYPWDVNEPSYRDTDGTWENYLLLWNVNFDGRNTGWRYNDTRNNPYAYWPQVFGGVMGFVCEYD